MYAGHVAIALGVRGVRRDLPLWVLVLASQACDWVELVVHPFAPRTFTDVYSHAYPFVLVYALVAAALVWVWKRSASAALTVLLVYLSHPVADFITGYKPLWLGGPNLGLQVVAHPGVDFAVQGLVCFLGFAIYWRSLPATRRRHLSAVLPLLLLLTLQGLSDWRIEWNKLRRQRLTRPAVATLCAPGDRA